MTYTVYSKWKSGKGYQVERSFEVETYAKDMAKNLRRIGKLVKIKTR